MTDAQQRVPTNTAIGSLGPTAGSPDVFDYYARLRELGEVVWDEVERAWLVTSYDAVRELARRDEDFIGGFVPREDFSLNGLTAEEWVQWNGGSQRASPALVDAGPDHDRIHRWWTHMYTPKDLQTIRRERFRPALNAVLDRVAGAGAAELVRDYAQPATPRIMAEMLDIPYTDEWIADMLGRFRIRGAFLANQGLQATPDPELRRRAWAAIAEIREMLLPYVRDRRSGEGADLISRIWRDAPEAFGPDYNETDVISVIVTWWSSGSATIGHACINGLYLALQQKQWRDDAAAGDASVLQALVEESLRLYGPSHWVPRLARRDLVLGGASIKAGDRLLVMIQAANVDAHRFEEALCPRLDRRPRRSHYSFSAGRRTCAGQALARAELHEMISVLLERFPDIGLDPGATPPVYEGLVVRTWAPLHVTFTAED